MYYHKVPNVAVKLDALVIAFLHELDKIVDGFGGEFRIQFDVEIAQICDDPRVAQEFYPLRLEHVLLVAQEGAFISGVRG